MSKRSTTTLSRAARGGTESLDDEQAVAASRAGRRPETILAYRVSGPTGSMVEVDQVLVTATGHRDMVLRHCLDDGTQGTGFTTFVLAADFEVTVTEGGPVTFEVFRTSWNTDTAPFGDFTEIEITEMLGSIEVEAETARTLSVP